METEFITFCCGIEGLGHIAQLDNFELISTENGALSHRKTVLLGSTTDQTTDL